MPAVSPYIKNLALYFADDFIDHRYSGQRVLLSPSSSQRSWRFGRSRNDCHFLIGSRYLSRVHFTIYFRRGIWYIIDGAYFDDDEVATDASEKYSTSTNGTYLNGRKLDYQDPAPLQSGDKISGGHPLARIIAKDAIEETLDFSVWDKSNWKSFVPKCPQTTAVVKKIPDDAEEILIREAHHPTPAVPADDDDVSSVWPAIYNMTSWLRTPPASFWDGVYRIAIVATLGYFGYLIAQVIKGS